MHDEAYGWMTDPEPFCQIGYRPRAGCPSTSYLADGRFVEACVASTTAIQTKLASLADHIAHVVSQGAQEEMAGPDTSRRVALVQHRQPDRDWTMLQFPGDAMCRDHLALANVKLTVSIFPATCGPEPAPLAFLTGYLGPEAFGV